MISLLLLRLRQKSFQVFLEVQECPFQGFLFRICLISVFLAMNQLFLMNSSTHIYIYIDMKIDLKIRLIWKIKWYEKNWSKYLRFHRKDWISEFWNIKNIQVLAIKMPLFSLIFLLISLMNLSPDCPNEPNISTAMGIKI